MQDFIEYVIKGLVDHPDEVEITAHARESSTTYQVRLHPDDVGKVIGKQGNTVHAIRALLQVGSAKKGIRCSLEIVDDDSPA